MLIVLLRFFTLSYCPTQSGERHFLFYFFVEEELAFSAYCTSIRCDGDDEGMFSLSGWLSNPNHSWIAAVDRDDIFMIYLTTSFAWQWQYIVKALPQSVQERSAAVATEEKQEDDE